MKRGAALNIEAIAVLYGPEVRASLPEDSFEHYFAQVAFYVFIIILVLTN